MSITFGSSRYRAAASDAISAVPQRLSVAALDSDNPRAGGHLASPFERRRGRPTLSDEGRVFPIAQGAGAGSGREGTAEPPHPPARRPPAVPRPARSMLSARASRVLRQNRHPPHSCRCSSGVPRDVLSGEVIGVSRDFGRRPAAIGVITGGVSIYSLHAVLAPPAPAPVSATFRGSCRRGVSPRVFM